MTRINVVQPSELTGKHLVAEVHEITRIFGLARKAQYEIHKKKIPNDYTLGTGHCLFFFDKLKYITERYNSLCTEMQHRGYVCNRVDQAELERGIDRSLFWNYKVTDAALALNRARINERLADSAAKKQLKGK
jgi:hypothetical protein